MPLLSDDFARLAPDFKLFAICGLAWVVYVVCERMLRDCILFPQSIIGDFIPSPAGKSKPFSWGKAPNADAVLVLACCPTHGARRTRLLWLGPSRKTQPALKFCHTTPLKFMDSPFAGCTTVPLKLPVAVENFSVSRLLLKLPTWLFAHSVTRLVKSAARSPPLNSTEASVKLRMGCAPVGGTNNEP